MSTSYHNIIRTGVLALAVALSGAAFAQDSGVYIGGSVGKSKFKFDDAVPPGFTGTSTDKTDTAWKLNIGYQFTRHWGIEFGYVDFGDFSLNTTYIDPVAGAIPVSASADLDAWTLAAVGTLPLGTSNFSLLGKLGWARAKMKVSVSAAGTPLGDESDRGTDFFGGIGVRYDFNRNLGVQLEAERYNFDEKMDTLTLGVRYKF